MHRGNVVVVGNLGDVFSRGEAVSRASDANRTNRCFLTIFSLRLFSAKHGKCALGKTWRH